MCKDAAAASLLHIAILNLCVCIVFVKCGSIKLSFLVWLSMLDDHIYAYIHKLGMAMLYWARSSGIFALQCRK